MAIDLETTGFDPERDRIVEIGALRFSLEAGPGERFSTLVAIDRSLPSDVARLTGIGDADLAAAPPLEDALARLASFVGDAWLVGHNLAFDLAFLEAAGLRPTGARLDTAELASCLLPTAASYALQALVGELVRPSSRAHRALDDAEAAAVLCGALADAASRLRPATLEGALPLASLLGEGVAWFFARALAKGVKGAFLDDAGSASAGVGAERAPLTREGGLTARLGEALGLPLADLFAPDGPLARAFPRFEERAEQLAMAEAVEATLGQGGALVVEAGTGIGKSLAYLVPACRAARAGKRVVISTYTTNLQDQLSRKDLPQLLEALDGKLSVAVLKGRANYLCPRRWHLLRANAATPSEARLALKTLVWRERTASGDRAEINLWTGEEALWARVCAEDETCTARRCERVSGGCYLERARRAAERADVVVVNHALLLADARARNRLLPNAPIVIADEAHHLEEVASQLFGIRVDAVELRRALHRVAQPSLLASLAGDDRRADAEAVRAEAERAAATIDETFAALAALMPEPEARGFEDRRRITDGLRGSSEWLAVEVAAERLRDGLLGTVAAAQRLASASSGDEDAVSELEAATEALRAAEYALARGVHGRSSGEVCWLALEPGAQLPVLQSAPVHAGRLIDRTIVQPRQAAVFTSATLAVGESLAFATDRFGLGDRAASLRLGSPFDYRRQALLVLPNGLLDPYDGGFPEQVADVVAEIAHALSGRTLALFTAHTMLRAVSLALAARLEGSGIAVLAQGGGSSRRQMLERFASADSVLLGTAAFWEGVDLGGGILRCVVVVKLPFPVPDDPVVAGRAELYDDPFAEYHLPVAALRLKQGFGRLIRSREDHGAVVLLDRRVTTRAYGEILLGSLPTCAVARPRAEEVGSTVAAWCGSAADLSNRSQVPPS